MLLRSELPPELMLVFCAGAGLFTIFCAIMDYDWFMEDRKAEFVVTIFGRNGARIFYVLLGLVLITLGILIEVRGYGDVS